MRLIAFRSSTARFIVRCDSGSEMALFLTALSELGAMPLRSALSRPTKRPLRGWGRRWCACPPG